MNYHGTMKEMPASEQPYEKCCLYGPQVLSDAELLAVIMRTGSAGQTSLDLAVQILKGFEHQGGLAALRTASEQELRQFPGVGMVKSVQLRCIGECSRRIAASRTRDAVRLNRPESIAAYFMEEMRHLDQEHLAAAFFNTKGGLIPWKMRTRGTVHQSLASPREIFLEALRERASGLVLLHNHPSGDPTPSDEDFCMTERIRDAGRLLDIPLLDHIIIGDGSYISFSEYGLFV